MTRLYLLFLMLPIAVTAQTVPPSVRVTPAAGAQDPAKTPAPSLKPTESPKPPAKPAEPMRLNFKVAAPPGAYRVAVLDPKGDGRPVVVTLGPISTGGSRLTILRWDGKALLSEWTSDLSDQAFYLAAGDFGTTSGAACIVTEQSVLRWSGTAWQRRVLEKPISPVGQVKLSDGREALLLRSGTDFSAARVDFDAPESPLVVLDSAQTKAVLEPANLRHGVLHTPIVELAATAPADFAACGLLGFWDWKRDGKQVRVVARFSTVKPAEATPPAGAALGNQPASAPPTTVPLVDTGNSVGIAESVSPEAVAELWRSLPLEGRVADFCIGDARGDRSELLLVLTADAKGGRLLHGFSVSLPVTSKPSVKPVPSSKPRTSL